MNKERITEGSPWIHPRGLVMKTPDEVAEMLRLRACGWGLKRIARQLGCSHHTVKDYVLTGVKAFKSPERPKRLDGLEGRLRERFIRHRGNADVARQDLLAEKHCSQPANAANRRAPPSPGGEGRGVGDDAVRNTPGPAAADRLRRASGRDRRGEDQSIVSWRRSGIRGGCISVRPWARSKSTGSPGSRVHLQPSAPCRRNC